MCYERKSFASQDRKAAETDQAKRMATRRTETVDALLRDAGTVKRETSPAEIPAKEAAPAK
jgi:hypothetical protein